MAVESGTFGCGVSGLILRDAAVPGHPLESDVGAGVLGEVTDMLPDLAGDFIGLSVGSRFETSDG